MYLKTLKKNILRIFLSFQIIFLQNITKPISKIILTTVLHNYFRKYFMEKVFNLCSNTFFLQ